MNLSGSMNYVFRPRLLYMGVFLGSYRRLQRWREGLCGALQNATDCTACHYLITWKMSNLLPIKSRGTGNGLMSSLSWGKIKTVLMEYWIEYRIFCLFPFRWTVPINRKQLVEKEGGVERLPQVRFKLCLHRPGSSMVRALLLIVPLYPPSLWTLI